MAPRLNLFENEISVKFGQRFANTSQVITRSTLSKTVQELVSLRVSQINGCGWCVDIHTRELAAVNETPLRVNLVAAWRESTVFTDAERAALALAEEGTRIADGHPGVSDETWAEVREHYDDNETAARVALVAQMTSANRFAVIVRQQGGTYEPGMFAALAN